MPSARLTAKPVNVFDPSGRTPSATMPLTTPLATNNIRACIMRYRALGHEPVRNLHIICEELLRTRLAQHFASTLTRCSSRRRAGQPWVKGDNGIFRRGLNLRGALHNTGRRG